MIKRKWTWFVVALFFVIIYLGLISDSFAAEGNMYASVRGIDTLWVMIAAFMVFIMQAGFGMLEAGLIRTKNTCNILMNNFLDFCMASMGFFCFGYAIMFGIGNGFIGHSGWFLLSHQCFVQEAQ